MATDEQNLASLMASRDNVIALIQTVTTKPRPSYSIDGQNVKWSEYFEMLTKQLDVLMKLIQAYDEPYETTSTIYT